MRTLTIVALAAVAEAAVWPRAPFSPLIHKFYCFIRGHDPAYGPCPEGENLSIEPYPPGYFDQFQQQDDSVPEVV